MDINEMFPDHLIPITDVESHIEYDSKHLNLDPAGITDIKYGKLTKFEAVTGKRIEWPIYQDGSWII